MPHRREDDERRRHPTNTLREHRDARGNDGGTGDGPYRAGNGVLPPRVKRKVDPQYSAEAMRAKIQGTVLLEAVVQRDGRVTNVRVIRSLDQTFGLDVKAIEAARKWEFYPGTRLGEPVPVPSPFCERFLPIR